MYEMQAKEYEISDRETKKGLMRMRPEDKERENQIKNILALKSASLMIFV